MVIRKNDEKLQNQQFNLSVAPEIGNFEIFKQNLRWMTEFLFLDGKSFWSGAYRKSEYEQKKKGTRRKTNPNRINTAGSEKKSNVMSFYNDDWDDVSRDYFFSFKEAAYEWNIDTTSPDQTRLLTIIRATFYRIISLNQ